MTRRGPSHDAIVYSPGTQVVSLVEIAPPGGRARHPRGAVGVVVSALRDATQAYRVRFPDGYEMLLQATELVPLARYKQGTIGAMASSDESNLLDRVIFRCVIGSQAYGLANDSSDVDRRGVYLPPAKLHWSLYGVVEQIENDATQEAYWELQKFLVLALKANPNVLECLYSPVVEFATPLAKELLAMRSIFLSRLIYQTYNGYVLSQFKKIQTDLRNQGQVKWKHVMHLIRLLLSGIEALRTGVIPVRVDAHRDDLLAIRKGSMSWDRVDDWRRALHREFDAAYAETSLPERPDYERANGFLVRARGLAVDERLP